MKEGPMIPWQFAALMLPVGFLAGFGLKVLVDYTELAAYRWVARRGEPTE